MAAQFALLIAFALLPGWSPLPAGDLPPAAAAAARMLTASAAVGAVFYAVRGVKDLGANLTPLPTPLMDNRFVRHGVYALVRHPLYSALLHAALAWAAMKVSLIHLIGTLLLLLFFDRKAAREEAMLIKKHPEYIDYRHEVKKFVPWIY